ncbi:hypothetical protein JCM11641_006057 [Rhodosporidiobolus odoratus]
MLSQTLSALLLVSSFNIAPVASLPSSKHTVFKHVNGGTAAKVNMAERSSSSVGTKATAWIPVDKVRGVNLGSLFVSEPLGCKGYPDEWSCNKVNGLRVMQRRWENHWNTFYQQSDFDEMATLGINTVRLPLGYWTVDSTIDKGEYYAKGSMKYVKQVLRWAKRAGLDVILDFHAAPGSQSVNETFTGQKTVVPGFFSDYNYGRAYKVLQNWTRLAHTDPDFSTVVMIEVVNEPKQDSSTNLTSVYYPQAQKVIRATEQSLGISCTGRNASCLTIQFMDDWWGAGHPKTYIDTSDRVAYDDHNYAQWTVPVANRTREGYISSLCKTTRPINSFPVITGEWSLSTIGGGELTIASNGSNQFFRDFSAAAIMSAEKGAGQIFWSWKTELNSSLWGYRDAVQAGYIPKDLSKLDRTVCKKYP